MDRDLQETALRRIYFINCYNHKTIIITITE